MAWWELFTHDVKPMQPWGWATGPIWKRCGVAFLGPLIIRPEAVDQGVQASYQSVGNQAAHDWAGAESRLPAAGRRGLIWRVPNPAKPLGGSGRPYQTLKTLVTALALVGLAGCDLLKEPRAGVSDAPLLSEPAATLPPSPQSEALRAYYTRVQTALLGQGLLRTDGGSRDAPFSDRILAQNFIRIAAFDEYASTASGPVQSETVSTIRRWNTPVRIGLRFGASVTPAMRSADTARVAALVAQLARATRHTIRLDTANPNFIVNIVNEDERQAIGPAASAALPGLTAPDLAGIINMPRSTYCLVYAQSDAANSTYTRAFAVIRAEHPDLLRLSCLHEEIAQGLGLANDSPQARPSIFNDNEEFALLTPQDELMLRILYDARLSPGMTADQARPIAQTLATQFMGGES